MKTLNVTVCLMLLFVFALFQNGYAVDQSQATAEHLKMAKYYEDKAAEQDALIAEHEQMKANYKQDFFINEKVSPMNKLKKMEQHCDAIIETARKQKNQLLEFAKWHRLRVAEMQGK